MKKRCRRRFDAMDRPGARPPRSSRSSRPSGRQRPHGAAPQRRGTVLAAERWRAAEAIRVPGYDGGRLLVGSLSHLLTFLLSEPVNTRYGHAQHGVVDARFVHLL